VQRAALVVVDLVEGKKMGNGEFYGISIVEPVPT
jgi:hypothetical protein